MQATVMIWLAAFIPAGWVLILLTSSDVMFVPLTIFWITTGVILARRVTASRCPRCGGNFCEKSKLPYWYGLFNSRCESCGLTLYPEGRPRE